jgi:hypothetical protein
VMYTAAADPVAYARDLFAPEGLDVHVMRSLGASAPAQVASITSARGAAGRRRGRRPRGSAA